MAYSKDIICPYVVEVLEMGCTTCDKYKWIIHDTSGNYVATQCGEYANPEQSKAEGIRFAQRLIYKEKSK